MIVPRFEFFQDLPIRVKNHDKRYSDECIVMCLLAGQCEISTRSWSKMLQGLIKEKLALPAVLETPHNTSINSYSLLLEPLAKIQIKEFLENSNQLCLFMGRV